MRRFALSLLALSLHLLIAAYQVSSQDDVIRMAYVDGGRLTAGDYADRQVVGAAAEVSSFYIATHEVSISLWRRYIAETQVSFRWDNYYWGDVSSNAESEDAPIVFVTWWHAVDFCNWLSSVAGLDPVYEVRGRPENWGLKAYEPQSWIVTWRRDANGYRLPTEAEWEYAATGMGDGSSHEYSGSDDPYEVGWWRRNSDGIVQASGKKNPNRLGVYDMSGNAREWCWNYYSPDPSKSLSGQDPAGPSRGAERVVRGGAVLGPPTPVFSRNAFVPRGTEFVTVRPVRNAE